MGELEATVVNCYVVGHERFTYRGRTVHGFGLRLGRWRLRLLQVGFPIGRSVRDYVGYCEDTTKIVVYGVSPRNLRGAKQVVHDLCSLLSLACVSQIRAYSFSFGEQEGETNLIVARGHFFRPLIDPHTGEAMREFLERCWPAYRRLKRSRKLPLAINYLVEGDMHQTAQIKLLLAFTALESLKATYATSVGIPFVKGRFRKNSSAPYSLKELLDRMLRDVGMRRGLVQAVRLRNALVHSGLTKHRLHQLVSWIDWSQSLVREYLLRLLEYRGEFEDYRTGDVKVL